MLLLIDNFDSFSHILADYLRQTGHELEIFRNDVPIEQIIDREWDGLVISPGPGIPHQAGNLTKILDHYAERMPVLGICLGHQALGEYFGADLIKCQKPVHGKVHSVFKKSESPYLHGMPETFEVTRYHSLLLSQVPKGFEILLETAQSEIMAMAHQSLPILGIQYHPEAFLTQNGMQIILNWMGNTGISKRKDSFLSLNETLGSKHLV